MSNPLSKKHYEYLAEFLRWYKSEIVDPGEVSAKDTFKIVLREIGDFCREFGGEAYDHDRFRRESQKPWEGQ